MIDLDSTPLCRTTETTEITTEMVQVQLTTCEVVPNTIEVLLHLTSDLNLTTRLLEEVPLQPTTATRC